MKQLLVGQLSIAVLLALGGAIIFSGSTVALSNISPNPRDAVSIDDNGREIQGGISHLLKNETVAQVKTLKLGAYFTGARSGHTLQLEHGIDGMKCLIKASLEQTARNPSYISVIIGEGANEKIYKIQFTKNRVCNGSGTSYRNIPQGSPGNKNLNRFFGRYNIPANSLTRDEATGYLYVPITIAYSTDDPSTPRLDEAVERGGSDENSVNFRARVDGSRSLLGPLGGRSLDRRFGLRSAFFQPSRDGYRDRGVRVRVQFGLPCGLTGGIRSSVGLYDADTDRFGNTYLRVIRNGNNLSEREYTRPDRRDPNLNIRWQSVNRGYRSTAIESSQEGRRHSIVGLEDLQPGPANNRFSYRFVIDNPADSNPNNIPPNANTLNVSIPFDSIYGDIDSCEYELRPDIPAVNATYTENEILRVASSIEKVSGGATGRHTWQTWVARYNAMPNRTINPNNRTDGNPCDVIPSPRRESCAPLFSDTYPATESRSDNYNSGGSGNIICFFTRIQKPTNTSSNSVWRYSDMACSILGKQPKVNILGHDLRVGGDIDASYTTRGGERYHSWGEYAMMSDGCNIGGRATSGADGYQGSNHPAGDLLDINIHSLTFANTTTESDSDQCKGSYDGDIISDFDVFRQEEVVNNTPNIVEIDRNTLNLNTKRVYYYPDATVRITGNLQYGASPYGSISRIPRVVIIAKNIVVNSGVRRIDPWLIALKNGSNSGKIATCDTPISNANIRAGIFPDMNTPNLLDRNTCDGRIEFNSPVMASEIYLYRTHGSTANAPARAAEVFNLRADSFLSTYAGGSGVDAVATTDAIVELPPRF